MSISGSGRVFTLAGARISRRDDTHGAFECKVRGWQSFHLREAMQTIRNREEEYRMGSITAKARKLPQSLHGYPGNVRSSLTNSHILTVAGVAGCQPALGPAHGEAELEAPPGGRPRVDAPGQAAWRRASPLTSLCLPFTLRACRCYGFASSLLNEGDGPARAAGTAARRGCAC
jgi:hypothetical protein